MMGISLGGSTIGCAGSYSTYYDTNTGYVYWGQNIVPTQSSWDCSSSSGWLPPKLETTKMKDKLYQEIESWCNKALEV